MGASNTILNQRPYERDLFQQQQDEGFDWGGLAGGVVGGAVGFFGSGGNPLMAMQGASTGYGIGSGKGGGGSFSSTPGWGQNTTLPSSSPMKAIYP
jgi:hypothetical protein